MVARHQAVPEAGGVRTRRHDLPKASSRGTALDTPLVGHVPKAHGVLFGARAKMATKPIVRPMSAQPPCIQNERGPR